MHGRRTSGLRQLGPLCAAAAVLAVSACGQASGSGVGPGYSYAEPERSPHPGIAEGRPVVEIPLRGTWYLCPEIDAAAPTPLITDPCLSPTPDVGSSRIDDYWLVEPSVECDDGRRATDLGGLGWGFVGDPVIPQRGASPDRGAVLVCLGVIPPG